MAHARDSLAHAAVSRSETEVSAVASVTKVTAVSIGGGGWSAMEAAKAPWSRALQRGLAFERASGKISAYVVVAARFGSSRARLTATEKMLAR